MPLIISQNNEISTDAVSEYIQYNQGFLNRYNSECGIAGITISIDNHDSSFRFTNAQNFNYSSRDLLTFWYRRGCFSYMLPFDKKAINNEEILEFIQTEWSFVNSFLFQEFPFLGSYTHETYNNKLTNISIAKSLGFNIPCTIITTNKNDALNFIEKFPKVITKTLHNAVVHFNHMGEKYDSTGTRIISQADINILDDTFCPMLLQNYVEKEFEIRVFFFEKSIYPMAIFSQLDEKTKIDFRNYNNEKPNRNVPYIFPDEIKDRLLKLIDRLGLNTGSIDLILDTNYDYVFLEVNPSGQFDWLSKGCNYYVEEGIAKYLIQNETKTN